jgi:deoxyribodipyrimidine photo-lyase
MVLGYAGRRRSRQQFSELAVGRRLWRGRGSYFRIFNPVLQGAKFDPTGAYVRRWVSELAKLPDRLIHEPWQASANDLAAAGVTLGRDYPAPIVEHGGARRRALAAFQSLGR